MSKRFGRNQRRKMREKLTAYESENFRMGTSLVLSGRDLKVAYRQIDTLERQLRTAKEFLGPNHPAFPAANFDPGYKPQPEDPFRLWDGNGCPTEATVMRFGAPRLMNNGDVHFMLHAGEGRFGYAITTDMLRQIKPVSRDALAWAITSELVNLLLDAMRKEPRP